MIPTNPQCSRSSTTAAEFNLRFSPASLSINSLFSPHSVELSIITLRSISLSFKFHSRHIPVSTTTSKQRANIKCRSFIFEMLELADRSLRNIILDKLAPRMPLLFCPGYAEAIQDRFKLLDGIIVPSLLNILRRRNSRLFSEDTNNYDSATILRKLWAVMTTSLKRKYLGCMILDHFIDIASRPNISIHTNTMLSEANSIHDNENGTKISSDEILSLTSEPRLADSFSEDMSFWAFDGEDNVDGYDACLKGTDFDDGEGMLYDSDEPHDVESEEESLAW
ncbi:hypothetical protein V1519DRAFT_185869 [Lipomyces tetrasporus]